MAHNARNCAPLLRKIRHMVKDEARVMSTG